MTAAARPGLRPLAREGENSREDFARSVTISTAAEAASIVLALLALRAAAGFGPVGFGIYAVGRRALQLIAYPALLGLGISLPRHVAHDGVFGAESTSRQALLAALLLLTPGFVALALLALIWPGTIADIFYGDSSYVGMARSIVIAALGLGVHTLAHGLYRGRMQFHRAALLHVLGAGLIPLLAILAADGPQGAIALTGAGWMLAGAVSLVEVTVRRESAPQHRSRRLSGVVRALASHGVVRVPGELALFALFAVPVLIVARTAGAAPAGFLSLGLSVVALGASGLAGFGVVLLPYISRAAARGDNAGIVRSVGRILGPIVLASAAMTAAIYVITPPALVYLLGTQYANAADSVRLVTLGIVPYVVYVILRNPLDAVRVWPYNSINLSVSLGFMLLLLTVVPRTVSPAAAVLLSLILLGALTLASWRHALHAGRTGVSDAMTLDEGQP